MHTCLYTSTITFVAPLAACLRCLEKTTSLFKLSDVTFTTTGRRRQVPRRTAEQALNSENGVSQLPQAPRPPPPAAP